MSTAFVLTGGGSLGAVQVGMLLALRDCKIEPDLLVGTSVGAVNAAYLAGPGSTRDRLEALVGLWQRMRRQDIFAPDPLRWLGAARGTQSSLFAGTGLERLLQSNLGYDGLDDARVPVEVTATDLVTGQGIVMGTGAAVSAVRASAAVPGLLPPVVRAGRTLVDGAMGDLDVLAHTAAHGVTDIYLLPAGYPCAGAGPTTTLGSVLTALSLLLHPPAHGAGPRLRRRCAAARPAPAVPPVGVTRRLQPDDRSRGAGPREHPPLVAFGLVPSPGQRGRPGPPRP